VESSKPRTQYKLHQVILMGPRYRYLHLQKSLLLLILVCQAMLSLLVLPIFFGSTHNDNKRYKNQNTNNYTHNDSNNRLKLM